MALHVRGVELWPPFRVGVLCGGFFFIILQRELIDWWQQRRQQCIEEVILNGVEKRLIELFFKKWQTIYRNFKLKRIKWIKTKVQFNGLFAGLKNYWHNENIEIDRRTDKLQIEFWVGPQEYPLILFLWQKTVTVKFFSEIDWGLRVVIDR